MISILHILDWFKSYIFFGGFFPIVSFLVIVLYARGYFYNKIIQEEKIENGYSLAVRKYNIGYVFFTKINSCIDFIIALVLKFVVKYAWEPSYSFLESKLTDEKLKNILTKLGANFSIQNRVEVAKVEFDTNDNAFWWNKIRAPHFRNTSPVISGMWFNGKSIDSYVHFLISIKDTFKSMRVGVIVALCSFVVLALVYRPQTYFGYLHSGLKHSYATDVAQQIINDPTIIQDFRKDVWSEAEVKANTSKAFAMADDYAFNMINKAQGYDYYFFGYIFKNGILGSLFLSLAIGLLYVSYAYKKLYKDLRIPFIKDMHEEYAFSKNINQIKDYKMALAGANTKATNFDKSSPLTKSFISTGTQEEKGRIGAIRKGDGIYQSLSDKMTNTSNMGDIGEGKTELLLKPFAVSVLHLKNHYLKNEIAYNEIFDTRTNLLTKNAKAKGYLDKYIPLPENPVVIAMSMMDIKSQVPKDIYPEVCRLFLQDEYIAIGAKIGQYSFDPIGGLRPKKLISLFNSIASQMGDESKKDVWSGTALSIIEKIADVVFLFSRTKAGKRYMKKHKCKIWSLHFISEIILHDPNLELMSHVLYSIYEDSENHADRLADVLTMDRIKSIEYIITKWHTLPSETKAGVEMNMNFIMGNYRNEDLISFMTGVGEKVLEIGEMWGKISGFDLDSTLYPVTGKLLQLIAKTRMQEEAISRQHRNANTILDISKHFQKEYPQSLVLDTSIELLSPSLFNNNEAIKAFDEYLEHVDFVKSQEPSIKGIKITWESGTFEHNLKSIVQSFDVEPQLSDFSNDNNYEVLEHSKKALALSKKVRELEPRFAKDLQGIVKLDVSVFEKNDNATPEEESRRKENLEIYYVYKDALTKLQRELMVFLADEFPELITIDKSGECFSESNFPNISRSARWIYFIAAQTVNAYINKIGTESTNNFLNQMRSSVFLSTGDQSTRDLIVKLGGSADIFHHEKHNEVLLQNGVATSYVIYSGLNYYISEQVQINKELVSGGGKIQANSPYPYCYDVFSVAEPIEIENKNDFKGLYTRLFEIKQNGFDIPSFKLHFLNQKAVKQYSKSGSDDEGIKENSDDVLSSLDSAEKSMKDKYDNYIKNGFEKNVPLMSDKEFVNMGSLHAFVSLKVAGMTIQDHVIVANQDYYKAKD